MNQFDDLVILNPLYATREYAEQLFAANNAGAVWPTPDSAGQALVLADLISSSVHGPVATALSKLAEAYRAYAQIAWRWDPSTGEFR